MQCVFGPPLDGRWMTQQEKLRRHSLFVSVCSGKITALSSTGKNWEILLLDWPLQPSEWYSPFPKLSPSPNLESLEEVSTREKLWQLSGAANDMTRDCCGKQERAHALQSEKYQTKSQSLTFVTLSELFNRSCIKRMKAGRLRELMEMIYVKGLAQEIVGSNCYC